MHKKKHQGVKLIAKGFASQRELKALGHEEGASRVFNLHTENSNP